MEPAATPRILNDLAQAVAAGRRFSFFLGAGASATSGVLLASEMMQHFRKKIQEEKQKPAKAGTAPLNLDTLAYGALFKKAYDKPGKRQDYIRDCVRGKEPSRGYYFLASLMNAGLVEDVFTTNFDDLFEVACASLDADRRPMVFWHTEQEDTVKRWSGGTRIVKLHGDHRHESIRNTASELEEGAPAWRTIMRHSAERDSMLVVGYGGSDKEVMQIFSSLVKDDQLKGEPEIYWCVRENDPVPAAVEEFADGHPERFTVVTISGFDELMEELHEHLETAPSLQKQNKSIKVPPAIERQLSDWLEDRTKKLLGSSSPEDIARAARYGMRYLRTIRRANLAVVAGAAQAMAEVSGPGLNLLKDEFYETISEAETAFVTHPSHAFNIAVAYMWMGQYDRARGVLDMGQKAYELGLAGNNGRSRIPADWNKNRHLINLYLVKVGKKEDPTPEDAKNLHQIFLDGTKQERAAAAILLKQFVEAERLWTELLMPPHSDEQLDPSYLKRLYVLRYLYPELSDSSVLKSRLKPVFDNIATSSQELPSLRGLSAHQRLETKPSPPVPSAPQNPGRKKPKKF